MPRIVDSLIAEIDQEAETTRRVLARVPGDKLDWKPHDKSMSLGELSFHIARVTNGIAEMLIAGGIDAGDLKKTEPGTIEELLPTFDDNIAQAKGTLGTLADDDLMKPWTLTKDGQTVMEMPRIGLARAIMMNHLYHHRGQLSVYLRLLDVPVPSIYGPSADENPFA